MPLQELGKITLYSESEAKGENIDRALTKVGDFGCQVGSSRAGEGQESGSLASKGYVELTIRRTAAPDALTDSPTKYQVLWRGRYYKISSVIEDDRWTLRLTLELVE